MKEQKFNQLEDCENSKQDISHKEDQVQPTQKLNKKVIILLISSVLFLIVAIVIHFQSSMTSILPYCLSAQEFEGINQTLHFESYCYIQQWDSSKLNMMTYYSIRKEKPVWFSNFRINITMRPNNEHLTRPQFYDESKTHKYVQAVIFNLADYHNVLKLRPIEEYINELEEKFPYPHYSQPPEPFNNSPYIKIEIEFEENQKYLQRILVFRKETSETLFDTENRTIIFNKEYIEFEHTIPTMDIFGFGSSGNGASQRLQPGSYSLIGNYGEIYSENTNNNRIPNGFHPMYLMREQSGKYHILFFRTGRPLMINLKSNKRILWRIQGGPFAIEFITCSYNPQDCIHRYHRYIGGWKLPAFWTLGLHQFNNNYKNQGELRADMERLESQQIPIESISAGLSPLMKTEDNLGKINFSWNQTSFPKSMMEQFFKDQQIRHVITMQQTVCASQQNNNPAYTEYKTPDSISLRDRDYNGRVNVSGLCKVNYLPDFFYREAEYFWDSMMNLQLRKNCYFHGILLDNKVNVDCEQNRDFCQIRKNQRRKYDKEPFDVFEQIERNGKNSSKINYKYNLTPNTPYDTMHFGEKEEIDARHYAHFNQIANKFDFKSQFYYEEKTQYSTFLKNNFPFIVSQATAPGTSSIASYISPYHPFIVSTQLANQLSGLAISGADICQGSQLLNENSYQLCLRQFQASLFIPLIRNNLQEEKGSQSPLKNLPKEYKDAIKQILRLRMSLIKSYYTQIYRLGKVGSILRPTFFNFFHDSKLLQQENLEHQYMAFESILIFQSNSPKNQTIEAYFPDSRWFDPYTFQEIEARKQMKSLQYSTFDKPLFYYRGGHTWFQQDIINQTRLDQLDSIFKVRAAFQDFSLGDDYGVIRTNSMGYLIDSPNYSDEGDIHERCALIGSKNCTLEVVLSLTLDTLQSIGQIVLESKSYDFKPSNPPLFQKNIWIDEIVLMGIWQEIGVGAKAKEIILNSKFSSTQVKSIYEFHDQNFVKIKLGEKIPFYHGARYVWGVNPK